ncbi:MAG: efflux RND transporter periplasmic adaptor subunit [Candidatus Hydrogenedentota bacterium]
MRKFFTTVLVCFGVVAVGAAILFLNMRRGNSDDSQVVEAVVQERHPNVAVQAVKSQNVDDLLYLTGRVAPWEEVTLSSEIRGKIEWQGVEEGDVVRAGQELIKVNTTSIQVSMDRATAEFKLAEQELARIEELRGEGISSPQDFDRAVTQRDAMRAALKQFEIQLEQSVVTAEFDGIADTLEHEQGEYVEAGSALVRLVQVDKVKVLIGLPEREVTLIHQGDHVNLVLDAYEGREFEGTFYRIATSADLTTRTFLAEVEVVNPEGLLKPGMIARAAIVRKNYPNAITVPLFSVVTRESQRYVFVEKDAVAQMRPVTIGFFQKDVVHIVDGLSDGDRVIVAGHRELSDGDRVVVREPTS